MGIEETYQEQLDDAGLGPESVETAAPAQDDIDLAEYYIRDLRVSGLRLRALPSDMKKKLCDALEPGQRVSIGGIGYERLQSNILLTDMFDGKPPPAGGQIRGH